MMSLTENMVTLMDDNDVCYVNNDDTDTDMVTLLMDDDNDDSDW